jgi:hypothetical protein
MRCSSYTLIIIVTSLFNHGILGAPLYASQCYQMLRLLTRFRSTLDIHDSNNAVNVDGYNVDRLFTRSRRLSSASTQDSRHKEQAEALKKLMRQSSMFDAEDRQTMEHAADVLEKPTERAKPKKLLDPIPEEHPCVLVPCELSAFH